MYELIWEEKDDDDEEIHSTGTYISLINRLSNSFTLFVSFYFLQKINTTNNKRNKK